MTIRASSEQRDDDDDIWHDVDDADVILDVHSCRFGLVLNGTRNNADDVRHDVDDADVGKRQDGGDLLDARVQLRRPVGRPVVALAQGRQVSREFVHLCPLLRQVGVQLRQLVQQRVPLLRAS